MSDQTRDLLSVYAEARWSPELREVISDILDIFDAFDHALPYELLDHVLLGGSEQTEETAIMDEEVLAILRDGLNYILSQHQIELHPEVSLDKAAEFVSALYRIQFYEDSASFVRILESDLLPEEKLSMVLAEVSRLDKVDLFDMIDTAAESTIRIFSDYFDQRDKSEAGQDLKEIGERNAALRKQLMSFLVFAGEDSLAVRMMDAGFEPGFPINLYYPYVSENIESDNDEVLAKNLLSLFLYASDTFNRPVEAFSHYSEPLFTGSMRAMKVSACFSKILEQFLQHVKAEDDSKRLSVV